MSKVSKTMQTFLNFGNLFVLNVNASMCNVVFIIINFSKWALLPHLPYSLTIDLCIFVSSNIMYIGEISITKCVRINMCPHINNNKLFLVINMCFHITY